MTTADLVFTLFGFLATTFVFGIIGLFWWIRDQKNPWVAWWHVDQPPLKLRKGRWKEGGILIKPPGEKKKRRVEVRGITPKRFENWRPGDLYLVDPKTLDALNIRPAPDKPFPDEAEIAWEGPQHLLQAVDGRTRNEMADYDLGRQLDKGASESALAEFLRSAPFLVVLALGLLGFAIWVIYGG